MNTTSTTKESPGMLKTTSSRSTSVIVKTRYLVALFRQYRRRASSDWGSDNIRLCVEEYRECVRKYLERDLTGCCVVEIGFGARPMRVAALAAAGARVYGIDLEQPLTSLSFRCLTQIARTNGVERAAKSLFREICFGRGERNAFAKEFGQPFEAMIEKAQLYVGSASDAKFWRRLDESVDVIYSEDVIEHIPPDDIETMSEAINDHVREGALLLWRPNMYSGIVGGHIPEWYHSNVDLPNKKTRAWGHLSDGDCEPSVYLNKLSFGDYVRMFSKRFEILEVRRSDFGLGRKYLTEEARRRIPAKWSDEDLLTNNVLFVMRNRGVTNKGMCSVSETEVA